MLFGTLLFGPPIDLVQNHDRPKWSHCFELDGAALKLVVYLKRMAPTELEVRRSGRIKAHSSDDCFFDGSSTPFFKVDRGNAYLAFVADPGAGSGEYASIWRIWDHGQQISPLGMFMYADLRAWFTHGTVREFRPAKYATDDVMRVYPHLFDDQASMLQYFLISYWFDPKLQRFLVHRIRSKRSFKWHYGVRLPKTKAIDSRSRSRP